MTENTHNAINPEDGISIKVGTKGAPLEGARKNWACLVSKLCYNRPIEN